MSNFLVAIPSYKRADRVETIKLFPKAVIFCNYGELEEYKKFNPKNKIVECDESVDNVVKKRNFILNWARENKVKNLLQMDDDFFKFVSLIGGQHKEIEDVGILEEVIERMFIMARDAGTRVFSFQQTADVRRYNPNEPFSLFCALKMGTYGMVLDDGYLYDNRFSLKQDMDLSLDTLLKYRFFIVDNRYSFVYKPTMGNVGGCGEYRTTELEKKMIELLERKWGKSVISTSTNKSKGKMTVNIKNPLR